MRKINHLTPEEKQTLEEGYRNSSKPHFRNRCHSILVSNEGYKVKDIASLFKVRTRTIYTWFDNWETHGICGLIMRTGRGVKAELDHLSKEQMQTLKESIADNPQNLHTVGENLTGKFGFTVTKNMLKRVLKKNSTILGVALGNV